jgi:crotonobetainyl-CoA:carnitine CoA-transferase CaiB-like acyl-CoA transferase
VSKPLPLSGIKVIDFSRLLPGPFATRVLGEFGADVIKVEPPLVGDPSRYNHPIYREHSVYFNEVNAHKRSITVDLASDGGKAVVRRLLEDADVVVETYRPGVAAKLGIDYESVREYNKRVVYCSISGFGQNGPLSHIAGHDLVIQGLTGLMGNGHDASTSTTLPPFHAADYAGGLYAVLGVQAALAQREKTGEGCNVDIAMFEALFSVCLIPLSSAMARSVGFSGEPRMEAFGGNPRYRTYLSKDGRPVAVTLLEPKAWREFCERVDRLDLVVDNENQADRLTAHGPRSESYQQALADYCASYTWDELMRQMEDTGLAICPVCSPEEALSLPHVKERGLVGTVDHPVEGRVPYLTNPLVRAGLASAQRQAAPGRGADVAEVLREVGYNNDEIERLRASGAIEWPTSATPDRS